MRTRLVRVGLGLLAVLNLYWGAWALASPRRFFDTFPGFGHHWTAAYPPYNEHLVVDLGATFATLGLLTLVGAVQRERRVRLLVLAAVLVFNGLHLAFHATHRGTMAVTDFELSTASLIAGIAGPIGLVVLDVWPSPRTGTEPPSPGRR